MKLKIGHRNYTLRPLTKAEGSAADGALGLCSPREGFIAIDTSVAHDDQAETVLHEVIHALWDAYGLPQRVTEEDVATILSKGLCAFLQDNPVILGCILAGLDGAPIFPPPGDA